jgi:hypothetical protein
MMDEHRQQKIIGILEHNDSNSVPFFETKKQLLENGYSEKEIVLALYSFPYDGKPNAPKEENPLTKWYNEHPERADKVAKTLLHEHAKNERNKSYVYAAAAEFAPDIHSQAYYEVRTFDQLGLPYFTLFFISIVIGALMVKFNLPDYVLYIYILAVNTIVFYRLFQAHQKTKK